MNTFDHGELELLLSSEGGPHLSLFLSAPKNPFRADVDSIRIENVSREARQTLAEHWMTERQATAFLEPLENLVHDSAFRSGRRHGVAIYLSADVFKIYPMHDSVEQQLTIARMFRLKPILSSIDPFASFYLLTLSKTKVAIFSVTAHSIAVFEPFELPSGFEDSLVDVTADRGAAEIHSGSAPGEQTTVYHGQGGLPDREKIELREYLRRVDSALRLGLDDHRHLVVLAGVDSITSAYREISKYPRLAGSTISGNVDHLLPDQLFQRVLPIAIAEFAEERDSDATLVREHRHHSVATDPEQVLCAAFKGQIDVLFVDVAATLFGIFYPDTRTLKELSNEPSGDPGDPNHDLIESAIVQTYRHRGRVHCVPSEEMPTATRMAALMRY